MDKPVSQTVVDYHWVSNLTDTSATVKIISNTPNTVLELSVNEGEFKEYTLKKNVLTVNLNDLKPDTLHNLTYIQQ